MADLGCASAVSVFWIVAKPECAGPGVVSCSGRSVNAGEYKRWQRATHSARAPARARGRRRRRRARARASGSCRWTASPPFGDDKRAVGRAVELELDVVAARSSSAAQRRAVHLRHGSATTPGPARGAPRRRRHSALPASSAASRCAIVGLARRRPRRLRRADRAASGWRESPRTTAPPRRSARRARCSAVVQHQRRVADGRGVGADEREAVLGAERNRRKPGARQRLRRPAAISPSNSASPSPISGSARCDSGGEIGDADRAERRHDADARRALSIATSASSTAGDTPEPPTRHARSAREHHRAHRRRVGWRGPTPTARARTARSWYAARSSRGKRLAGVGAERGIDAVDGRVVCRQRVDDRARRRHALARRGRQRRPARRRARRARRRRCDTPRATRASWSSVRRALHGRYLTTPLDFRNSRATSLRLLLVAVDLVVELGHRRFVEHRAHAGSGRRRSSGWRRARPCARPARGSRAATGSCRPSGASA